MSQPWPPLLSEQSGSPSPDETTRGFRLYVAAGAVIVVASGLLAAALGLSRAPSSVDDNAVAREREEESAIVAPAAVEVLATAAPLPTAEPAATPTPTTAREPTSGPTPAPTVGPPPVFTCSVSPAQIVAGETSAFRGTSSAVDLEPNWYYRHGDGYGVSERRNPSTYRYPNAGSYEVVGVATYLGEPTQIACGTVEVVADTRAIGDCSKDLFIGLEAAVAETTARGRACPIRFLGEVGLTDSRPGLLKLFVVDGVVTRVLDG